MKKIMLITGSTKGLGLAIANKFKDDYNVVGVARENADFCGDLKDINFRSKLVAEINPDVVINNAAVYCDSESRVNTYLLNYVAAIDLTISFSQKMKQGHIINISSVSAGLGLSTSLSESDIDYALSKKALSEFTQLMQFKQTKNLKICCIEPGYIMTEFCDIQSRFEEQNPQDYLTQSQIKPMSPNYLAEVIQWVLSQPADIVISSMRIMNQRNSRSGV